MDRPAARDRRRDRAARAGDRAALGAAPAAARRRHRRPGPADGRPVEEIAGELARAAPEPDEGDESTPTDTDEELRRFAETVTAADADERDGGWLGGVREYIADAGPVPSSRFA